MVFRQSTLRQVHIRLWTIFLLKHKCQIEKEQVWKKKLGENQRHILKYQSRELLLLSISVLSLNHCSLGLHKLKMKVCLALKRSSPKIYVLCVCN